MVKSLNTISKTYTLLWAYCSKKYLVIIWQIWTKLVYFFRSDPISNRWRAPKWCLEMKGKKGDISTESANGHTNLLDLLIFTLTQQHYQCNNEWMRIGLRTTLMSKARKVPISPRSPASCLSCVDEKLIKESKCSWSHAPVGTNYEMDW